MTMTNEIPITVVGNLTADPELRYTSSGVPVVNVTIAQTPRTFDRQSGEWKDGEPVFMRGTVWRETAEHVAASFVKGSRVIATGHLEQRSYQDREGNSRQTIEMVIDEIGGSVRYGTTSFTKSDRRNQNAAAPAPVGQAVPQAGAPVNQPQAPVAQYQAPQAQQAQPAPYPVQAGAPQAPAAPAPAPQVPVQPVYAGAAVDDDAF